MRVELVIYNKVSVFIIMVGILVIMINVILKDWKFVVNRSNMIMIVISNFFCNLCCVFFRIDVNLVILIFKFFGSFFKEVMVL